MRFEEHYLKETKIIVKDDAFEGKTDPTQYSYDDKVIQVKSTYDYKNDPEGWIVHEEKHAELDRKNVKDDGKDYPTNNIEREAYIAQFKALKKRGMIYKDLFDKKKFPTLFIKLTKHNGSFESILRKYWENA